MTKEQVKKKTEEAKPFIDYLVDRLISRKFIAACTATWLVYNDKISGTEWSIFMGLYISTLVFLKVLAFYTKRQEQGNNFMNNNFNEDNPHPHNNKH